MSRDLFAEFGDFGTNASSSASLQPSPEVATSVSSHSLSTHQTNSSFARGDWSGFATTEPPANETQIDDTEDWGDFEVAGNDVQEQQTNISAAPDRGQHLPAALNNLDLHDGGASRTSGAQTFTESGRKKLSSNHPFARNPDILFDAEDPSEPDDDFGDFEDAQPEPVTATATAPRMQQNTTHSAPLQSQAKPQPLSMDLLDWDVPIEPATVQKTQQRVPQSTPLSHQARPQPSSMDPLDWEPKPSVPTAAVAQTPPRPKLPSVKSHARRTNSISNSVRLSQAPATHRRTPSKTTAPAPAPEEDFSAWDDFEPSAAPLVTQVTTQAPASISEPDSTLANSITLPSQILSPIAETDGSTTLPPPNIPPPPSS
ncbi:hypothetical protein H2203_004902 [Taxawa tesnikishii (nom. ined.)]|nr:hypothetical protein H2203_004902 [Dothideales sp. JES 119]